MSGTALALVLGSAAVHAFWNLIYKQSEDKIGFAFFKSLGSLAVLTPFAVWGAATTPVAGEAWIRAIVSGVGYGLFFIFLSEGYATGDYSVVYPVSRGIGPALAALGGALILGEQLSPLGVTGVAVIIAAVVLISSLQGRTGARGERRATPVIWATLVGVVIAVYGVNDRVGVTLAHPFTYLWLGILVSIVLQAPYCAVRVGLKSAYSAFRRNARSVLFASVLDTGSYILYLFALQHGPTAYVTPVRSVSVVIAAVLGGVVLRESQAGLRVCAAAAVAGGVLLIGLLG